LATALGERGNHAIVEAVIELGSAFGLRVVAEGVRDKAT
jgi:EAL domain-containing protein (putative c-di-GMP-specific phosphodiesterase class I)